MNVDRAGNVSARIAMDSGAERFSSSVNEVEYWNGVFTRDNITTPDV